MIGRGDQCTLAKNPDRTFETSQRYTIGGGRELHRNFSPPHEPKLTVIFYTGFMERICSQCHAVLDAETKADWCPACGGSLVERPELQSKTLPDAVVPRAVLDHRGIVLPRRHSVGGVITPK